MQTGFGIVGTGMIAHFHAKAIQAMPGGCVAGCFNQNADKANAFAVEYGCKAYSTLSMICPIRQPIPLEATDGNSVMIRASEVGLTPAIA